MPKIKNACRFQKYIYFNMVNIPDEIIMACHCFRMLNFYSSLCL